MTDLLTIDPDFGTQRTLREAEVDQAIVEGRKRGIKVSLLLIGAPPWANGVGSLAGRPTIRWISRCSLGQPRAGTRLCIIG